MANRNQTCGQDCDCGSVLLHQVAQLIARNEAPIPPQSKFIIRDEILSMIQEEQDETDSQPNGMVSALGFVVVGISTGTLSRSEIMVRLRTIAEFAGSDRIEMSESDMVASASHFGADY